MKTTEKQLRENMDTVWENTYLEYVNDYLTLEVMALDKNMSVNALRAIVDRGRDIYQGRTTA